jgi:hypothetical protein
MSKEIDSTGNIEQSAVAPHNDITTRAAGSGRAEGIGTTLERGEAKEKRRDEC